MKLYISADGSTITTSPPSRGRGLKHPLVLCAQARMVSPPSRGRGLKHADRYDRHAD